MDRITPFFHPLHTFILVFLPLVILSVDPLTLPQLPLSAASTAPLPITFPPPYPTYSRPPLLPPDTKAPDYLREW